MTAKLENLQRTFYTITGMSTHLPFLISRKQLDDFDRNNNKKDSSEKKYLTLGEEIPLLVIAFTIGLPFIINNPASIADLVLQWTGPEGKQEYLKRVAKPEA